MHCWGLGQNAMFAVVAVVSLLSNFVSPITRQYKDVVQNLCRQVLYVSIYLQ